MPIISSLNELVLATFNMTTQPSTVDKLGQTLGQTRTNRQRKTTKLNENLRFKNI